MADIDAAVTAYNRQRQDVLAARGKALGRQNLVMAGLALGLFALAWNVARTNSIGVTVALLFIGVFALAVVFFLLRGSADTPGVALQAAMREQMFPALFPQIDGLVFSADTKASAHEIPQAIMPGGDRIGWGDLVEGGYDGLPIAINEVTVSRRETQGDTDRIVETFRGVAIHTALAAPVPELSARTRRPAVARWISATLGKGSKTPHIPFEDAAFSAAFDVHCNDEGFARAVFSAQGRARLLSLQDSHAQGALQIAADGASACILLEHAHDFLELPPLARPFDAGADGRRLRGEMQGFLDLVDAVRRMLARSG